MPRLRPLRSREPLARGRKRVAVARAGVLAHEKEGGQRLTDAVVIHPVHALHGLLEGRPDHRGRHHLLIDLVTDVRAGLVTGLEALLDAMPPGLNAAADAVQEAADA